MSGSPSTRSGDRVVVAKWLDGHLVIAKRYLRRYQAARQLHLSLQICVDRRGGDEIKHLDAISIDIQEPDLLLTYHGAKGIFQGSEDPYFTRLVGKRILAPPPIEQSGLSPYDDPEKYEDFIIGIDTEGKAVEHTCDPDQLANYFGKNPDAPHFLTKVFFRREVLAKYYSDTDRYEIRDGYLSTKHGFGLQIDNALADHVVVFLGDLGQSLPHREQQYWRSFNVPPAGEMSETGFRRSFLGEWANSDRVEHRFAAAYEEVNQAWTNRFGRQLFRPLHQADAHVLHALHVPMNPSVSQFDEQIVRLAKLVVGPLNEKQIVAATTSPDKTDAGIAKLKRLLVQESLDTGALCSVLRRIQGARSKSAAHNKGSEFDLATLLGDAKDLPTLFNNLLDELTEALGELSEALASLVTPVR